MSVQSFILVNKAFCIVSKSQSFLRGSNLYVSVDSSYFRNLPGSYFLHLVNKTLKRKDISNESIQELAKAQTSSLKYTFKESDNKMTKLAENFLILIIFILLKLG